MIIIIPACCCWALLVVPPTLPANAPVYTTTTTAEVQYKQGTRRRNNIPRVLVFLSHVWKSQKETGSTYLRLAWLFFFLFIRADVLSRSKKGPAVYSSSCWKHATWSSRISWLYIYCNSIRIYYRTEIVRDKTFFLIFRVFFRLAMYNTTGDFHYTQQVDITTVSVIDFQMGPSATDAEKQLRERVTIMWRAIETRSYTISLRRMRYQLLGYFSPVRLIIITRWLLFVSFSFDLTFFY